MVVAAKRFTSADLESLPDDGNRYEIIEGELYVSQQPGYEHQYTCGRVFRFLDEWNDRTGRGVALTAPGVIFAEDEDVAPDIVWITRRRLEETVDRAGHLHGAPELVVEVVSPGRANEHRDREAKLKLYSRRGVEEYWILDWNKKRIEVHRRKQGRLRLVATLSAQDSIESPLLPGFSCRLGLFFLDTSH